MAASTFNNSKQLVRLTIEILH